MQKYILAVIIGSVLLSCSQTTKKVKQPDKYVAMDGDFIAGCAGGIRLVLLMQELIPNDQNIDATCMELYLKWLDYKNKDNRQHEQAI